jgi:hypothetical protein
MATRFLRLLAISSLIIAAASAIHAQGGPAPSGARVELFTPQDYVKQVRQVTSRFTAPMVALGDPRLDDPFTIDCGASGKGRWADGRNWVYDFDADLPAGVACRFTLKPGLKALDGSSLSGDAEFTFNTGGPAISASLPQEGWRQLDEDQVFILKLDAPATADSVRANAYCVIEGVAERIPVEVLTGADRTKILAQRKALGYDYLQLFWKNGATSDVRVRNRSMENSDALVTVLRCQRRLPPATQVLLNWGAGIATDSGITTRANQQLAFRVRPAFTAQVECTRTNFRSGCIPVQPLEVNFSAPVPRDMALAIRIKAKGKMLVPVAVGEANVPVVTGVRFPAPLPENTTLTVVLPQTLVDDAGRPLENASRFPLSVSVDAYPPLAKFSGEFGILEAREGGVLPVTLRNVEARLTTTESSIPAKMLRLDNDPVLIASWLRRVEKAAAATGEWIDATAMTQQAGSTLKENLEDQGEEDDAEPDQRPRKVWRDDTGSHSVFSADEQTTVFSIAKPAGERPAEVVGIPLKKPGFYVVELQSRALGKALLGRDEYRYVATSALVTDLAVHLKWGREASRVWVTRLSDGTPVPDADIAIIDFCVGAPLWQGRTDHDGLAAIGEQLGEPHGNSSCNSFSRHPVLVVAKAGDEFSFTQSGWDQGITPYQFAVPVGTGLNTGIFHTVLDRALFRAGETVSMKHFLRQHVLNGIAIPSDSARDRTVTITHDGSGQSYSLNVAFDSEGVGESQWTIPAEAKLGNYTIAIEEQTGGRFSDRHPSGHFKVEQFRLPSMHGSVDGSAQPLVNPKQADLDLRVAYMSGGGASGLAVKLRTLVEPRAQRFADYADFQFGGAPVQEGVNTSGPDGFRLRERCRHGHHADANPAGDTRWFRLGARDDQQSSSLEWAGTIDG